jgi:hypothetical protein
MSLYIVSKDVGSKAFWCYELYYFLNTVAFFEVINLVDEGDGGE